MIAAIFTALFLAGACSTDGRSADWTAYLRRVGPIRVGMSAGAAHRALGDGGARKAAPPGDGCSYLASDALPKGLGVMLEGNLVVRLDIAAAGITTASGVGVGDTEEKIKTTYPGRIEVTPHKYDPQGHYLRYVSRDAGDWDVGMVFETDGKRVTSFRVGAVAAIALVERCG
jgi:hypothetical protein